MNYFLHILTMTAIYLPSVLGYNLVLGRGKILHFGSTGVTLVTAYAIFLTQRAFGSYVPALFVGLFVVLLISAFFAWLALCLDGDALGILTIAVHLSLLAIVFNWSSLTRGALGITQIPRMSGLSTLPAFALVSTVIAVLFFIFMLRIDRSFIGRSLSALAENQAHAQSLGVSRSRTYLLTFLLAGSGAFFSNILYPQYIGILHPNDFGFPDLIFYVMCVTAGGPGSVFGVTLSTILLIVLKEGLRFIPLPYGLIGPIRLMLFGMILISAVWYRRKELFPVQRTV